MPSRALARSLFVLAPAAIGCGFAFAAWAQADVLLAAVEVPTGIPTGLPPAVADAAARVASDGLLGSLLILALFGIVILWLEMRRRTTKLEAAREKDQAAHDEEREEWQRQIQAQHDKRIADLRDVLAAIQNATATMAVFSQTQADRTSTLQDMANKLSRAEMGISTNGEMLDRNLRAFEGRLGELSQGINNLVAHLPRPMTSGAG